MLSYASLQINLSIERSRKPDEVFYVDIRLTIVCIHNVNCICKSRFPTPKPRRPMMLMLLLRLLVCPNWLTGVRKIM